MMLIPGTERRDAQSAALDLQAPSRALEILLNQQVAAAQAVSQACPAIERAAGAAAKALKNGNRLAYVGAGSSGLLAMADGLELPGTFGVPTDRIAVLLAGGVETLLKLTGASEDDPQQAEADVASAGLGPGDCAICVSASGTTPYTARALQCLRDLGITTIGMANNADTSVLTDADIPILLSTPPEVLAGSTRMGAGTAQKIALNMFSTLMAIHLGHVHDGYMINLRADNSKLKNRAQGIITGISGCSPAEAKTHLDEADGAVKVAVLLASGVKGTQSARQLLDRSDGVLRTSLESLGGK